MISREDLQRIDQVRVLNTSGLGCQSGFYGRRKQVTDHQHQKERVRLRRCQEHTKKLLLNLGEKVFLAGVIAHQVARTTVGIAILSAMYPVLFMPERFNRNGPISGRAQSK